MRARKLRGASTDAERLLWSRLRDRRLDGYKFRPQHPITSFFADFACVEAGIVVELDGGQHCTRVTSARDASRTERLADQGFHVLRFSNRDVLTEADAVLRVIRDWLVTHHPHPHPLPQAGEGVRKDVS